MEPYDAANQPVAQGIANTAALTPEQPEFLPRDPDAADYLTQKLGVRVTPAALEQCASRGTGPAFRIVLGPSAESGVKAGSTAYRRGGATSYQSAEA
jgi:hypothetical protein